MSDFGRSVRRAAALLTAAVCVICGATALVCGVYMAFRGITPGAAVNGGAVFYLSGESASESTASVIAAGYRRDGEAGVVYDGFVAKRLYTDKSKAMLDGEVREVTVACSGFTGENADADAEFYDSATSVVEKISALTDELEDGRTSESLASLTIGEYAVYLGGYTNGGQSAVAAESAALLMSCAAESSAASVKRSAVLLAILLSESLET